MYLNLIFIKCCFLTCIHSTYFDFNFSQRYDEKQLRCWPFFFFVVRKMHVSFVTKHTELWHLLAIYLMLLGPNHLLGPISMKNSFRSWLNPPSSTSVAGCQYLETICISTLSFFSMVKIVKKYLDLLTNLHVFCVKGRIAYRIGRKVIPISISNEGHAQWVEQQRQ